MASVDGRWRGRWRPGRGLPVRRHEPGPGGRGDRMGASPSCRRRGPTLPGSCRMVFVGTAASVQLDGQTTQLAAIRDARPSDGAMGVAWLGSTRSADRSSAGSRRSQRPLVVAAAGHRRWSSHSPPGPPSRTSTSEPSGPQPDPRESDARQRERRRSSAASRLGQRQARDVPRPALRFSSTELAAALSHGVLRRAGAGRVP